MNVTTRESQTSNERQQTSAPPRDICRWMNDFDDDAWVRFILEEVSRVIAAGRCHLVLVGSKAEMVVERITAGNGGPVHLFVVTDDPSTHETLRTINVQCVESLDNVAATAAGSAVIACATRSGEVNEIASRVLGHPVFGASEFVYKVRPADSYDALRNSPDRHDRPGAMFVSTLFDDGLINEVYCWTLSRVERKCSVKDAYDLYQLLRRTQHLPGIVAEFGSYRGHSGLIIAETLRRLGAVKPIYLLDTFDHFPNEVHPVDRFWSGTHDVDFDSIRRIFADYRNVTLVRGDFAETIDTLPDEPVALAYVDCDSYRSVKLVTERIFPRLVPGGVIAFEDYGHDFCLGARRAVNEYFERRRDAFAFFSAFSGIQIVTRMPT